MSPRKLKRRNLMDQSNTPGSNRSRARSLITSNKKTLPNNETNLEDQEKDKSSVLLLSDSQQKRTKTQSTWMLKKDIYLEKSKRRSSSKQLKKSPIQSPTDFDINSEEENKHNNSHNGTITPQCSPISVTLTPLRTTKTPKRSPVNLASPKIPSEVPFRLSKTPRKLQLFSNSPTKSSSLDKSLENRNNISNNMQNTTLGNISVDDINTKSSKLRKNCISTEKVKLALQRLSKSPKIVVRLPSSRSELRAPKIKLDNDKNGNISILPLKKNVSRKVSAFSNKNNNNDKSLSSEESELELTLADISNSSEKYKEIISKKPIVLLERIPLLDSFSVLLKTQSNQHFMDNSLDVLKYIQKQLFTNLSSLNHSNSHTNHKYPIKTEESILSKSFNSMRNAELNNTLSLISSTPISSRGSNSTITPISQKLENISKNCTYDMNGTNDSQNNTMVIDNEEITDADGTYDLFEPRTPHLRQRFRKRATAEVDNGKKEIKKVFKVRFTTPERDIEKVQSNNNVVIRKTPRIKYISRRRSNSLSNTSSNKNTPKLESKRRSTSMFNINTTPSKKSNQKQKTPLSTYSQIKFNTEDEERKDIKAQNVKKKIPNFVEIHKQMFAKMESVVDNKKRLMQQHEAVIAKTPKVLRLNKNNMKKFRSDETKDESHNRFGFRVNKADATNIILKKQHTNVQKQKREENKSFLKGVRTNRRFELLMKLRKISD